MSEEEKLREMKKISLWLKLTDLKIKILFGSHVAMILWMIYLMFVGAINKNYLQIGMSVVLLVIVSCYEKLVKTVIAETRQSLKEKMAEAERIYRS